MQSLPPAADQTVDAPRPIVWSVAILKTLGYVVLIDLVILSIAIFSTDPEPFRYVGF